MSRALSSGAGARAVLRELGSLVRSGPFRIAVVVSLLLHLALLVFSGGWGRVEGARSVALMRVRLVHLPPESAAVSAPAAGASADPVAWRESPGRSVSWQESRPRLCF